MAFLFGLRIWLISKWKKRLQWSIEHFTRCLHQIDTYWLHINQDQRHNNSQQALTTVLQYIKCSLKLNYVPVLPPQWTVLSTLLASGQWIILSSSLACSHGGVVWKQEAALGLSTRNQKSVHCLFHFESCDVENFQQVRVFGFNRWLSSVTAVAARPLRCNW